MDLTSKYKTSKTKSRIGFDVCVKHVYTYIEYLKSNKVGCLEWIVLKIMIVIKKILVR